MVILLKRILAWRVFHSKAALTALLLVASSFTHSFVVEDNIIITNDGFNERLAEGLLYLEDKSGRYKLDQLLNGDLDVEFKPFQENTLQMGYNQSTFWFKLKITNQLTDLSNDDLTNRFYLSIRYPLLDSVHFYHITPNGIKESIMGDRLPFYNRYFDLNNYVFPISLYREQTTEVYIRVQSDNSVSIPLYLQTERSFAENQHTHHIYNGIYLGITLGLLIYNCFLWVGIRKPVYGYYAFSILSILSFNSTITGYTYRLWPDAIAFQQIAVYQLSILSAIAISWFGMAFLNTASTQPKAHKFLLSITLLFIVILPVVAFLPPPISAKINVLVTVSGVVFLSTMAVRSLLMGNRSAAYFLIGQGGVLLSVIFVVLTSQGFIPLYYLAPEVLKWCSAFELIFFSIALADLVNSERRLREKAQQESATAQKESLQAQIALNHNLDKLVHNRTNELEHANRLLKELSSKDELTGLRNRRYLNEIYPKEYKRAYRDRKPISVLMLDLDHFKQINDCHGHQAGDICLASAGRIIAHHLHRPNDFAVRYGGEEFVMILPDTTLSGAVTIAERIRQRFQESPQATAQQLISVTVSIGVVSEIPADRQSHERLLKQADDLLYKAKQLGRNRVETLDITSSHSPNSQCG